HASRIPSLNPCFNGLLWIWGTRRTVNGFTATIQDSFTAGKLTLNPGLRVDRYDGIGATATQAEPRIGVSYLLGRTNTVLRAGYARTLETPYNENLLVATSPSAAVL